MRNNLIALMFVLTIAYDLGGNRFCIFNGLIEERKFPKMELLNADLEKAIDTLAIALRDPRYYMIWFRDDKSYVSEDFKDYYDTRDYFFLTLTVDSIYPNRICVMVNALYDDYYPMPMEKAKLNNPNYGIYVYKGKKYLINKKNAYPFYETADSVAIPVQIEHLKVKGLYSVPYYAIIDNGKAYSIGTSVKGLPFLDINKSTNKGKDMTLKNICEDSTELKEAVFKYIPITEKEYGILEDSNLNLWYLDFIMQAYYSNPEIFETDFFVMESYRDYGNLEYVQISSLTPDIAKKLTAAKNDYVLIDWYDKSKININKGKFKKLFIHKKMIQYDYNEYKCFAINFNDIHYGDSFKYSFVYSLKWSNERINPATIANEYFDDFYNQLIFD